MSSPELEILRNPQVILTALSLLVPREEAATRIEITKRICRIQEISKGATTWPEDS
jgi:hypothetical protein